MVYEFATLANGYKQRKLHIGSFQVKEHTSSYFLKSSAPSLIKDRNGIKIGRNKKKA
jgi:hypothetical protein